MLNMDRSDILRILNTQFEIIGDVEFEDETYSGFRKENKNFFVSLMDNEWDGRRDISIIYNCLNHSLIIEDNNGQLPIKNLKEFCEVVQSLY